jgi:dihydrodipicolinate synthase/N-acetylneuraminate lyase
MSSIPFSGIIPPLVTPLLDASTLDRAGAERLIEHVLGGGVHGLFILGTTGEGPGVDPAVRREFVTLACGQVRGRVPVLVGITDTSFSESVALARYAAEAGASAVVVAPPPYFPTTPAELLGYIRRLAAAIPLPLLLYNMPAHTKVFIDAPTVVEAALIPGVAGLKDSSGNLTYFHQVQRLLAGTPKFALLVGPEELLAASVLLGGHGGVNGGANLFPALYVQLYEAARAGDLPRVRCLHEQVITISTQLYAVGRTAAGFVQVIKGALALSGICSGALAEPFRSFGPNATAELKRRLDQLKHENMALQ